MLWAMIHDEGSSASDMVATYTVIGLAGRTAADAGIMSTILSIGNERGGEENREAKLPGLLLRFC